MYADSSDLTEQFDVRDVCQYASDDGVGIDPADLPTNAKVLNALRSASGKVDAVCERGKKYTRAQLATLAADADRGQLLRNIVCTLAMAQLVSNRLAGAEIGEVLFGYKDAMETLADLRGGAETFDIPEILDAQVPESTGPDISDPNRPSVWNPMFGRWTPFR